MSETVRCPMCGAPNPADQEVCQVCGARLKPLVLRPQEGEAGPQEAGTGPAGAGRSEPWGGSPPQEWLDSPQEEEELPDWLRELAGEEAVAEGPEVEEGTDDFLAEGDLLGRLADLPGGAGTQAPEGAARPPTGEGETTPGEPPEEAAPAGPSLAGEADLPDWLSPGEEGTSPRESPLAAEAPAGEEGWPEWLSALEMEEQASAEEGAPWEETPASEEEMPDWLSALEAEGEAPGEVPPLEAPPPPREEGLPDWLGSLEEARPEASAEEEAGGAGGLSEWGALAEKEPETPPMALEEPAVEEAPLPDWLSELEEEAPAETALTPEAQAAEEELPAWLSAAEQEEEAPATMDWLAEVTEEAEAEEPPALPTVSPFDLSAAPEEEGARPPSAEGDAELILPAEAEEELALPAVPGEEEGFTLDELPDWLDNLAPESLGEFEEQGEGAEGEAGEITPGKLPDWLEAIRPEDVALEAALPLEPEEQPEVAETKGPLAGLSGVLPGITLPRPRKTGVAATRLNLSEEDARYAEVLRSVVQEEEQVTPPSPRWRWLPQRLLRVTIALVLLAVAWLPSLFAGLIPPLPESIPREVLAANQVISALPENPPVLLAVDYNPAWRAEMESAAAPLVDHLMVGGARLAVISTQPVGPALAEHFLHGPLSGHGYVEGQQYVNLGYLSGGMAALQHLAASPTTAAPWSVNGYPAWEAAPLEGIHRLSDFALVVVITDDPEVARAWVEQVQPHLGDTPLLMVISAQAEPLVRPYYESQPPQLQGLVTGLMGGLAYMRLTGRLSEGVRYWGGFTWGIWAAILLLALGGLYNLILGLRARRQAHG